MTKAVEDGDWSLSSGSNAERKSIAACKSHSEAERRRRQRINDHLSTLRTLLPNNIKTDKASLLAEVVRHVRELKRQVADVARRDGEGYGGSIRASEWLFPAETDELTLSHCCNGLIKATLCCEDRPGLNRDLNKAVKSVRGRVVRAEMATVGGRTKSVVVVEGDVGGKVEDMGRLRKALKAVVDNRWSGEDRVAMSANKRVLSCRSNWK